MPFDTPAREPRQARDADPRPSPTRMLAMNETPHGADLLAATRFVQAGRLGEATALLQRLLRGEPGDLADAAVAAPPSTEAGILDLTAGTIEVTAPRRQAPTRKAAAP